MLVVVHHRDRQLLFQAFFDLETFGRLDVFQVDPAERDRNVFDGFDELVGVFRIDFDVEYVDIRKGFKEQPFAFHDRFTGHRPDIAQPEHGGAVRDYRYQVAFRCIFVRVVRIVLDRQARLRHSRGVGQRQVFLCAVRFRWDYLDLPRTPLRVVEKRLFLFTFSIVSHIASVYSDDFGALKNLCLYL